MAERIGFVGLGIMGRGMAANLLKAGFDVRVWNRTASRMDELVAGGAEAAESPADVAANCDVTVVCVSDTPDVEHVVLGENGILEGAKTGSLVIDCSTISPKVTKEIAAEWPRTMSTCLMPPSAAAAKARPTAR
jgi:3-hydroxyisobutyrate dehydrogenase